MHVVEIKNLSKNFGRFCAVDDISLSIESGKITGFVGKNGAGKTTTIRCILDFLNPSSGTITVFGMDSSSMSKSIKSKTAYMASDSVFYNAITPLELFKLVCKIAKTSLDRAYDLATYFELDLHKNIGELSYGNRKKVGIIQALLKDAKLLILDEPTNGLDPLMQMKFFELIAKEKAKGVSVFLSSHNLAEIEKYCDRALIIKDGRIIDDLDMGSVLIQRRQKVTYTTKDKETTCYEFDGSMNDLVKSLGELDLVSLEIKNASVEDDFIKYYKEEQ